MFITWIVQGVKEKKKFFSDTYLKFNGTFCFNGNQHTVCK